MRSVTPKDPRQLHLPLPEGFDAFARHLTQSIQELGQVPDWGWNKASKAKPTARAMPGLMGTWRRERR